MQPIFEKQKVETVRANILKAKGLKEPPTGTWKNHHYLRGQILCYLRARNGDVREATKRAIECMGFVDVVFEKANEYEEFPQSKEFYTRKTNRKVYLEKIKGVPLSSIIGMVRAIEVHLWDE